jgi:hypothetical protein
VVNLKFRPFYLGIKKSSALWLRYPFGNNVGLKTLANGKVRVAVENRNPMTQNLVNYYTVVKRK